MQRAHIGIRVHMKMGLAVIGFIAQLGTLIQEASVKLLASCSEETLDTAPRGPTVTSCLEAPCVSLVANDRQVWVEGCLLFAEQLR